MLVWLTIAEPNILVFLVDKEKAEKLDLKLKERNESRTSWFKRKLDEEIDEKK